MYIIPIIMLRKHKNKKTQQNTSSDTNTASGQQARQDTVEEDEFAVIVVF